MRVGDGEYVYRHPGVGTENLKMCIRDRQKDEYNPEALHDLSFLLVVAIIIHLVLAVIELALVCLGGSAADAGALAAIGGTWLLYVLELGLPLVAVFVLLRGQPGRRR